ncbi:MAG: hypothetical protein ACI9EF_003276 [Pseudohongiellaceae bacterium]|jgi:hypothetical protein
MVSKFPRSSVRSLSAAVAAAALSLAAVFVETPYADQVVSIATAPNQDFGVPDDMLGPPVGLGNSDGSVDVYSIGTGGEVVLFLDTPATNGAGTDIIVYENPFLTNLTGWDAYIELAAVAVSTNGVDWANFPNDFDGPVGPYLQGSIQLGADSTWFDGFAGVMPFAANPPTVNPLDVVAGGGDAFDLSDLIDDPTVINGDVDLDFIQYVKLTDMLAGIDTDTKGQPVWDCGFPSFSCADIDSVCAVNNTLNLSPSRPVVEFDLDDATGLLTLVISDFNGLFQVKHDLAASLNGITVPFGSLLQFFIITQIDSETVTLLTGPVPLNLPRTLLKVSANDGTGLVGGDAVFLP